MFDTYECVNITVTTISIVVNCVLIFCFCKFFMMNRKLSKSDKKSKLY